jgi:SAM-dependent methyltransferase
MKTVKQACKLAPNALSIDVSDQIEQLDELIHAEGNGDAFYQKTFITAGMRDLLHIQVDNLHRKLGSHPQVSVLRQDSTALQLADASQDAVVLFFLLHEQPADVRRQTLAEAWRVTKPGGKLVVVDYHRPSALHPLYLPMMAVLKTLEPFALDLWRADLTSWLPPGAQPASLTRLTRFGGLYQQVVMVR